MLLINMVLDLSFVDNNGRLHFCF